MATLTWKKVKGAKKYIVYRALKKNGKYKKFAVTKKLTVTKKSKGDYYYKVKAFNGKKSTKYSAAVHLFALSGNIYNSRRFGLTMYIGGFPIRGNTTSYYYCSVRNDSKRAIRLNKDDVCKFVQYDPATKKITDLNETGTISDDKNVIIGPGKVGMFTVKAGYPTVETDTYLIIQVPFVSGKKTFTMNIARDYAPVKLWTLAITK